MWRVRRLEEKNAFIFLATYRGFALVVAATLIFSVGQTQLVPLSNWVLISIASIYTLFKILRPSHQYHKPAFIYSDLGFDFLLASFLLLFSGGLRSPFALYALAPLLTSALLFSRKLTFSLAALPLITAIGGTMLINSTRGDMLFYPWELSWTLMGAYVVATFLLACLPYVMNINASQDIKAQAISEERKRLSWDMHDGVAQELGIIRWRMELLWKKIATGQAAQALNDAIEIRDMLDETQKEVKEIIEQLRVTAIDDNQGFVPTLAQFATEFTQNYGIKCELYMADGEVSLPALAELELLCVAQEALTNVRKHAAASNVQVVFESKESCAQLTIKDNGRGFDPQAAAKGYGLTVMAERVKSIGGEMSITTIPGRGAEIKVKIPGSQRVWHRV